MHDVENHSEYLFSLPHDERMAALVISVLMVRRETVSGLTGLMGLFSMMAAHLNAVDRVGFSEALRDLADHIECVGPVKIMN